MRSNPIRLPACQLRRVAALVLGTAALTIPHAGAGPVKVFVLAGQSNMQGHGEISPRSTPGTLEHVARTDPDGRYGFLKDPSGGWKTRDDVWIHYERAPSNLLTGNLTVGYGASNTTIGPELGFGHVMGDYFEDQVLIVKTAWGGKSLAVDFRPPRSGGTVGFYFNEILRLARDATNNIDAHFPAYQGQGFEIVGFGWHQGWNDRINQQYNDEYESNMVNFISSMQRNLRVVDLPFVIATTGMTGWGESNARALSLMQAQLNVARYPQYLHTVYTVEARGFWRPTHQSPADQGYHWNRNAGTYLDIGLAMGREMIRLLDGSTADYNTWSVPLGGDALRDHAADFDGDGLTNDEERIFGLHPGKASSRHPVTVPVERAEGSFRYTRRDPALTGLRYSVWTSPDLLNWTEDTTASQIPQAADPAPDPDLSDIEIVDVTLTPALLTAPQLHIQVRAARE